MTKQIFNGSALF